MISFRSVNWARTANVVVAAIAISSATHALAERGGAEAVVDPALVAAERKIAEKLAALGAEVAFCETGQVDKVDFAEEDPHSLAPQISTNDLKTIRPLLEKLSAVREVSFVMNVNDPAELRQLDGIPKLTGLTLHGGSEMRIEARHLVGLGDSGSLKHLVILSANVDDALPAIAEFDALESLTVYSKLDNARLGELAPLANLKALSIPCQPATDATAELLGKLPTLERVWIGKCQITDEGIKHIARLKRLEQINLSDANLSPAGVAELTACTALRSLEIGGNRIDDESLKHIGRLTSLVHLNLGSAAVTDDGIASLENLKELRSLNVAGTQVTQRRIEQLRKTIPKLEAASGLPDYIDPPTAWRLWQKKAHVEWKDRSISLIVVFRVMNGRNDKKLDGKDLAAIKGAAGLTSLGLLDCPIRDEDLDNVLRFEKLRWLCLAGTKITDAGVKRLGELPELQELDIAQTTITDSAIEHLSALKHHLKKLDVSGTQISSEGVERLLREMPGVQVVASPASK